MKFSSNAELARHLIQKLCWMGRCTVRQILQIMSFRNLKSMN